MRTSTTESITVLDASSSLDSVVTSNVTSQEYLLDLIQRMDKKSVLPLNGYKEIVRFLLNEFNDLPYLNEEMEIVLSKCRYGNPERTVARLNQEDNMIMPLITVSQNSITESEDRRRYFPVIMNTTYWNEEKKKAERVISLCDRPVTISYNINIWAKYMEDMDQLSQQVRLRFNPSIQLKTRFSKDSKVFLSSETNNYSFSLADREDRIIRKTFTASVETYIRSPKYLVTSTGEIEELNLDAQIVDTPIPL
jgi:RNase P subunit RPR2|tara:strand:+ start:3945 stop:4697 length:753 start_codon:yes stop_codon:yes gene_type:complete